MNETPAIILNIQRQPGANVIAVVEGIKALLPQLQAALPAAIDVNVLTDRTITIRASVRGRRIRADARRRAGGAGDLRVPAQRPRDADPEPVGAAVAGRHARRDVPARLQPQQSVADGADHRHRLRGRRRHRRDREHLPLYRGGRHAVAGGAEGLRADRLHHHLADGVADRGADPAAVHGRRGRPAVPRIRDHAVGHDPDFGRGVADAGADGLRQAAQAGDAARSARTLSSAAAAKHSTGSSRSTATRSTGCSTVRPFDAADRARHLRADGVLYVIIPKGFFPLQDTGLIQAISEAPQSVSYAAMAERQQQLAASS